MSDTYITRPSFVRRCREFVRDAAELGRKRFSPGRTALLVVDVQRYFVDPDSASYIPGAEHIVPRISALASAFADGGLPVVFTRHVNTPEDAGALALWWDDLIRRDDPLSEISPHLDTSVGIVLEKTQYDAFRGTGLEEILAERGIRRVAVAGVVTHLCYETTARSAFVRGFEVTILVDATITYDEEFHLATLVNLSHGFATPALARDMLAELEGA